MQVVYIDGREMGIVGFELPRSVYPLICYIKFAGEMFESDTTRGNRSIKPERVIRALQTIEDDSVNIVWTKHTLNPYDWICRAEGGDVIILYRNGKIRLHIFGKEYITTDGETAYY